MKEPRRMFDVLRTKGTAMVGLVSDELMKSEAFRAFLSSAMDTAFRGKARLDGAVGHALKTMNVPTRSEFKRALARIEALEGELLDRSAARGAQPRTAAPKRRAPARRKKAPPKSGA